MAIKILNFDAKKNIYRYSGYTLDTYHVLPKCHLDGCYEKMHVLFDRNGYSVGCPTHGPMLKDRNRKLRNPTEVLVAYFVQLANGLGDELHRYVTAYGKLESNAENEQGDANDSVVGEEMEEAEETEEVGAEAEEAEEAEEAL